jgi:hypothetical protein
VRARSLWREWKEGRGVSVREEKENALDRLDAREEDEERAERGRWVGEELCRLSFNKQQGCGTRERAGRREGGKLR